MFRPIAFITLIVAVIVVALNQQGKTDSVEQPHEPSAVESADPIEAEMEMRWARQQFGQTIPAEREDASVRPSG